MKLNRADAKKLGLDVPPNGRKAKPPHDPNAERRAREMRERLFSEVCVAHHLPVPVPEYQFAPPRKWRFDWLFEGWVALEIQGGNWVGGRHVSAAALRDEYEKVNEAQLRGFLVLFCTPADIDSGAAFALVRRALGGYAVTGRIPLAFREGTG